MIEGVIYRYKSPSGKYYIGQTIGEEERRHKFLHSDVYAGPKIDKARMKYGPENFEYTVLMKVTGDNEEEVHNYLDILEIGFIRMYDSFNNGYNCTIGGGGRSGYSLSEDIKEKIRKKLIGHQAPNKGIPMSEEQKKKLSESLKGKQKWKGRHHTEETKQKLREINKGQIPPNKGIPMSEESKRKNSESHKGQTPWNKGLIGWTKKKKISDESRERYRSAAKKRGISEETRKKINESNRGRHRVYNPDGSYRMIKDSDPITPLW